MFDSMPSYYKKSRVMNEILVSLENELTRLKNTVELTENQFFVILSDKNIDRQTINDIIPIGLIIQP